MLGIEAHGKQKGGGFFEVSPYPIIIDMETSNGSPQKKVVVGYAVYEKKKT